MQAIGGIIVIILGLWLVLSFLASICVGAFIKYGQRLDADGGEETPEEFARRTQE